jgi:Flp pilus assembly protein TadG
MASMTLRMVRRSERGNALIEFALVLPLLLIIFAGIVDFGLLFQRSEVVTNAAREGARIAVLPGYSTNDVRLRVRQYVQEGLNLTAGQVAAALPDANITVAAPNPPLTTAGGATLSALTVTVRFQHTYIILGPVLGLIGGNWAANTLLTATSTMRVEVPAS